MSDDLVLICLVLVFLHEVLAVSYTHLDVYKRQPSDLYIAYFQSFTNTYAPVSYLGPLFTRAISHPQIAALSIGTRPDCLPDEVISLLRELNRMKPVWVELGLQTIHEDTARFIRRGYELPVFEDALRRLKEAGLTVIVHTLSLIHI